MTKQAKFLLFVQVILAARNIEENEALNTMRDAMDVSGDDLIKEDSPADHLALDFADWRLKRSTFYRDPVKFAPKWIGKETIGKILVG